jgi:hypothetical protein
VSERSRIFVITGDELVRLTLTGARTHDVETVLAVAALQCVAVDPRDPNRVYVGTFDDGLYSTDDGGETWRASWQGVADRRVMAVSVSPSHREAGVSVVYAGTEPSNLYRSEDAGASWQLLPELRRLPSEPGWSFPPRPWTHHVRTIALHPTDPDSLIVGIELGGVMRSFDGGRTWMDHNPQAHSDAHQLLTHPLAPDRVYEVAGQGIAISPDRGGSWRRLDDGLVGERGGSGRPGPVVRVGESLAVRRAWSRRRPGAPAALARQRVAGDRPLGRGSAAAAYAVRAGDAPGPARPAAGWAARRIDAARRRGRGHVVAPGAGAARRDRARCRAGVAPAPP